MSDRGGAGRATGSPCATPRSRPHRDGSPPCFLSHISGCSLSLVGGPPRRQLAAVADSVLANVGSRRRRASYRVAVRNTPIATAPGWVSAVFSLSHFGLFFIPCRGAAAPTAGRRRRFGFSECRIAATPGELPGRRAQHPDRDRTGMGLRRVFSLTFRAVLYPLSGGRRADSWPPSPIRF